MLCFLVLKVEMCMYIFPDPLTFKRKISTEKFTKENPVIYYEIVNINHQTSDIRFYNTNRETSYIQVCGRIMYEYKKDTIAICLNLMSVVLCFIIFTFILLILYICINQIKFCQ